MTVMSNRSPIPVPERCVCENPITVESLSWYPEVQSHACGMLVGPTCTSPNGTLAPTNTWPWPPVPIFGSTKRVKSPSPAADCVQAPSRAAANNNPESFIYFAVLSSKVSLPLRSSSSWLTRYRVRGFSPSVIRRIYPSPCLSMTSVPRSVSISARSNVGTVSV